MNCIQNQPQAWGQAQWVLHCRPLVSDCQLESSYDSIEKEPDNVLEFRRDKKYTADIN